MNLDAGREAAPNKLRPPSKWLLLMEARALPELGAFYASRPFWRWLPPGDGHPVMVLPGMAADDISTRPLRSLLRRLGYSAHGWRMGRNVGNSGLSQPLRERILELRARHQGQRVSLIGWSLGGIYARELAKLEPDAVRQVITLGSPFTGDPNASNVAAIYRRLSGKKPKVEPRWLGLRQPPPVPTSSIYSRSDGIVAWPCCINERAPQVENIEVEASHCGLGHHPLVLYAIADRLAQAEGSWAPFRREGLRRWLFR